MLPFSKHHQAGIWNPATVNKPPLVTNAFLNYDMNYGSYVPAATSLLPVGSVSTVQLQFSSSGTVTYSSQAPSYIDMSTTFNTESASTSLSSGQSLLSTRNMTFSFWINPVISSGLGNLLRYDSGGNGSLFFRNSGDTISFQIGFADGSATSSSFTGGIFVIGQWNLVTIYIKPNQSDLLMQVYSNGVFRSDATVTSFSGTPPFGNSPSSSVIYQITSANLIRQRWSNIQLYLDDTTFTPADHVLKWNSERAYYGR